MLHIYKPVIITRIWKEAKHGRTGPCWIGTFPQRDKQRAKGKRSTDQRSALSLWLKLIAFPDSFIQKIPGSTALQIKAAHSCWVPDLGSLISIELCRSADRGGLLQWRLASFRSLRWLLWSLLKCFCMKGEAAGGSTGQRERFQINVDQDHYRQNSPSDSSSFGLH